MQHYFQLQYKIFNRQIEVFGIHPILAQLLIPAVFLLASLLIFHKTDFAVYIYISLAIASISRLSERNRNEFLQSCFPENTYHRLRLYENLLMLLPFALFLCFKMYILAAAVLLFLGGGISLINFSNAWNYSIPTPFSKHPFEFTVGFRKSYLIIAIAYFLTYMGIQVDNFELAAFSLIIIFLTSLSYYSTPESIFFVWIFSAAPPQFLLKKILTAMLQLGVLYLPTLLSISYFYPSQFPLLLGIFAFSVLYLATVILAKYASFPKPNSLPEVLILAACFIFPPALLIIIPYFYRRAIQKLKLILT